MEYGPSSRAGLLSSAAGSHQSTPRHVIVPVHGKARIGKSGNMGTCGNLEQRGGA
jgi:hypothetical protein